MPGRKFLPFSWQPWNMLPEPKLAMHRWKLPNPLTHCRKELNCWQQRPIKQEIFLESFITVSSLTSLTEFQKLPIPCSD